MSTESYAGKAVTVTGPVDSDMLGRTLMHEHLLIDMRHYWEEPKAVREKQRALEDVSTENLWWVIPNTFKSRDNLVLADINVATDEAEMFLWEGGKTIVDVSNKGLGRDPEALYQIALETGLNVIAGSGYYVDSSHPADMDSKSIADIRDEIVSDICSGIGDTNIPAGIIGEIGTSETITTNERKSLRAAAQAQRQTGAPITIHTFPWGTNAMEVLDVLEDAGADLERVVMGHLDSNLNEIEFHTEIAERGPYIEYDGFKPPRYSSVRDWEYPQDGERIEAIQTLAEEGYLDRILVSHDICTKTNLTKYGGRGYGHLLRDVVPRMRRSGFSEEEIATIFIDNPRKILTFTEPLD